MNIYQQFQQFKSIRDHSEQFGEFFKNVRPGYLNIAANRNPEISLELELNKLDEYAQKQGIWVFFEQNEIVGLIGFHLSAWDTQHFNKKFGKIGYFIVSRKHILGNDATEKLFGKFNEWAIKESIAIVSCKIESKYSSCSEMLQKNYFRFYECITERFLYPLPHTNPNVQYRYADKSDLPILKDIARRNTFEQSHFFLDNQFSNDDVQNMYIKWIENSFEEGQKIVITENQMEITGLLIFSVMGPANHKQKTAVWNFAAVENKYRGVGIGDKLFKAGINAAIQEKCDRIDSSLVDKNIISQRLHEKNGFFLSNTYYNFHKWFNVK